MFRMTLEFKISIWHVFVFIFFGDEILCWVQCNTITQTFFSFLLIGQRLCYAVIRVQTAGESSDIKKSNLIFRKTSDEIAAWQCKAIQIKWTQDKSDTRDKNHNSKLEQNWNQNTFYHPYHKHQNVGFGCMNIKTHHSTLSVGLIHKTQIWIK